MAPSDEVKAATSKTDRDVEIEQLRADLIGRRWQMRARLAQLEAERNAEIAAQQKAALEAEATRRLTAIKRAVGSLVSEVQQDDARFIESARRFAAAAETLNGRFDQIIALRYEAEAIAEVFGWPTPELAPVVVPAARPGVADAFVIVNRVGVRDNGYVRPLIGNDGRRTFEEPELSVEGRALIKRMLGRP